MRAPLRWTLRLGIPALVAIGLSVAAAERWSTYERPSPFQPFDAARLHPGQFRWAADTHSYLPVRVVIDLTNQRGYVFQGRALVGITTVSTGKPGHSTPTGTFPILEKTRWHRSNIYANAPMPFMQRLTWGGIALHAGNVYGWRRSHGCIRLPPGFAKLLYSLTEVGAVVTVARDVPAFEAPHFETVMATTDQSVATMTSAML